MFGFLAINGTGNDIDLLIIKEDSENSLIERELKIRKLLRGLHMPFDIFVLTPKELKNLYFRGSPFIKSILKEGRLIYMKDITKIWFKDAHEEYLDAKTLFSSHRYRGTCIHSQQAVEKTLKALLLERGIEIPKVHDIKFLLERALELGWDIELNVIFQWSHIFD